MDNDIHDNLMLSNNFIFLTKTIKSPCAWEKAFYRVKQEKLYDHYKNIYFIEDDVFSNSFDTFNNLIKYLDKETTDLITHSLYESNDNRWIFWPKIKNDITYFAKDYLARSFNPFCRLSSRLVIDILDFQDKYKTFIFHEILFPSIAKQNNYMIKYLHKDIQYKNYFSTFTYHRNLLKKDNIKDNKIYHSIKPTYDNSSFVKL